MFVFERTSSSAAPAERASRNGTIRGSARSAELVQTRLALCLNQSSPSASNGPRLPVAILRPASSYRHAGGAHQLLLWQGPSFVLRQAVAQASDDLPCPDQSVADGVG